MVTIDRERLFGKLNTHSEEALARALSLCMSKGNYTLEIVHWLTRLVEKPGNDIGLLLRHFDVDAGRLTEDLTRAVDRLATGHVERPTLSREVCDLVQAAWLMASVEHGQSSVRSGQLLAALIADEGLRERARSLSSELGRLSAERVRDALPAVCISSIETDVPVISFPGTEREASPAHPVSNSPALDRYTIDLTARAREGKIDPILGRDVEIRQLIDILMRRRQNNPILTGEAGVGKTAVVEGLAQRIALGDVPPALANVVVRTLDLGLLQAGAGVRGEFENRLKSVLEEVKKSTIPVILFIDEAHTLIGAGGTAGQGDAANLLKPALARGELRTIAATTWAEYKKYFETDAALARRFQVVKVEEPDEDTAARMIRGLVATLESHHGVSILDEAVIESVRLSNRYISGRQLPDKAVGLIDTAAGRVALGHASTPPVLEDCRRDVEAITATLELLRRESATGAEHGTRIIELEAKRRTLEEKCVVLDARWQREGQLVQRIRTIRSKLAPGVSRATVETPAEASSVASPALAAPTTGIDGDALRAELQHLEGELRDAQGDDPLLQPCVDAQAVAAVVSSWTGIPVGRMVSNEIKGILDLESRLADRVVGQSHALASIASRIRTSRAGLTDPQRPIGVFLLAGSSGVGKTETAMALADVLYGGEQSVTVINMSEYNTKERASLLTGATPMYVGYGEGGVLTESVRRRPYSVVLLDEVEKAHRGIHNMFYQVFDKGTIKDGTGRDIDFRNTVIIMTSNVGTKTIVSLCRDPDTRPDAEALAEALRPDLLRVFKPAFLARLTVVPYFPLADEALRGICELKLRSIGRRLDSVYRACLTWDDEVVTTVVARCREVDSGARNIDHILTGTLLPDLSSRLLGSLADGRRFTEVRVAVDGERFSYRIT